MKFQDQKSLKSKALNWKSHETEFSSMKSHENQSFAVVGFPKS